MSHQSNWTSAKSLSIDILRTCGASEDVARQVVESLLASDQRGAHTHGLSLLPLYVEMLKAGSIDPTASPEIQDVGACMVRVDGHSCFGQLTASLTVREGLKKVKTHGIAAAVIQNGSHLGRLGEWAEMACKEGVGFIGLTNTSGGALNVAGPGSPDRVLSTNPIVFGIPTFNGLSHDILVDFASSQVSGSRIRELANLSGKLDPDWVVSQDGESENPLDFINGLSALRPLGGKSAGHKGFGLMVAAELFSALGGGDLAGENKPQWFSNGAIFIFLDFRRFLDSSEWAPRMKQFSSYLGLHGNRLPGASSVKKLDQTPLPEGLLENLHSLYTSRPASEVKEPSEAQRNLTTRTW